jgi:CRP-like cAMP-binding protein
LINYPHLATALNSASFNADQAIAETCERETKAFSPNSPMSDARPKAYDNLSLIRSSYLVNATKALGRIPALTESMPQNLSQIRNRILASLPAEEYARLLPALKPVILEYKQVLYEPHKTIRYAYFPEESVISMVSTGFDKTVVEVGLAGSEGMVCVATFLGANSTPHQGIVQAPGRAMRLKANILRDEFREGGKLQELLLRHTQTFLVQIAQTSVCNRLHALEARLSRWLLMLHDRVQRDEFVLTQDIMSMMLGAQRTGVTEVAGALQKRRIIRYSRGRLAVLERHKLEETSCECYWIVREEHDRLNRTANISRRS